MFPERIDRQTLKNSEIALLRRQNMFQLQKIDDQISSLNLASGRKKDVWVGPLNPLRIRSTCLKTDGDMNIESSLLVGQLKH